ncbi:MAG: dihydrodipicolinate synthase family protein, partial [Clostridia bacterium]|nr:dihydrodipicolinate synthase family protein [Clostridia bacterium]
MAKQTVFTGSAVALITPFNDKGVDYDSFGALIDWHLEKKTDALVICGTTGEASTLTDEEHVEVIKYACERVEGKKKIIAGTGSNDTD